MKFAEKYITDEDGNRIGILLDLAEYQRLIDTLEELEAIQAYDAAKAAQDEKIPFEEAIACSLSTKFLLSIAC